MYSLRNFTRKLLTDSTFRPHVMSVLLETIERDILPNCYLSAKPVNISAVKKFCNICMTTETIEVMLYNCVMEYTDQKNRHCQHPLSAAIHLRPSLPESSVPL